MKNKTVLELIEEFEAVEGWRSLTGCITLILAIKKVEKSNE